jgi:hypothetical protein
MTYIISEGIVDTIALATYYLTNQIQQSFTIDIGTILSPILWAGTAVLAGYLGIRIAKTRQPLQRQETEPTIPRELQSV